MRRGVGFGVATGLVLLTLAPAAMADHHFVKISEVFPGNPGDEGAEFVELRSYSAGQNNFAPNAKLVFYRAGYVSVPYDLNDVSAGVNQGTALWGTTEAEAFFGVSMDTEFQTDEMNNGAGAVCLTSSAFPSPIDCVSWGDLIIEGAGAAFPGGIPQGSSLVREIDRGDCNTLLEAADDTDESSDDFAVDGASPTPNSSTPVGVSSCPKTEITKKPKAKSTDRTPKFEFSGGDAYDCTLDSEFIACDSTFAPGRLSRGKHKLEVQAREFDMSLDSTPAKYSWKIVKK